MEQKESSNKDEFVEIKQELYKINSSLVELFFNKKIAFSEYSVALGLLEGVMNFIQELIKQNEN